MKNKKTVFIVRTAIVSAIYIGLTYVLFSFAYGIIQLRLSEALCLMPLLYADSVLGLFIGCLLANIASPFGIYDIIFGSLITLVSGAITFACRKVKNKVLKIFLGGLPPVLLNAFFLPLIWYFVAGDVGYWTNFVSILISQTIGVYVLGIPLFLALDRLKNKGIPFFS